MKQEAQASAEADYLYPPPRGLSPLDAVRGSILVLDWQWLRGHELMDAYEGVLDDRTVLSATATDWMPFPAASAHWRALDRLDLPPATLDTVGRFVGEHVHNAFLATLIRLAGQLGVSPWSALRQSHKLWTRSWRGGGVVVQRLSQHAARFDVVEAPAVASSRFFRGSFRGAVAVGIAQLCARALVVELNELRTASSFALRVSWV